MKLKIIYTASILFAIFAFSSCTEESAGISKVTDLPTFTLVGESTMGIDLGTTYVEPGFKVTVGETDITSTATVKGSVDASISGPYTIVYEATNSDGFKRSVKRTVIVYDKSSLSPADISGAYVSNISRKVVSTGASAKRGPFAVNITKITDGLFEIDDLLGGWYNYGSLYGSDYAALGYIILKADNSITVAYSSLPGFGDTVDFFAPSSYNPATGDIQLNSKMVSTPGYEFAITLVKKEI